MTNETLTSGVPAAQPFDESLITYTNIIYGLHTFAVVMGVLTSASIVGNFIFGIPSIVAVILNYVKRSEVRGTFLESHFIWQIRKRGPGRLLLAPQNLWKLGHHIRID